MLCILTPHYQIELPMNQGPEFAIDHFDVTSARPALPNQPSVVSRKRVGESEKNRTQTGLFWGLLKMFLFGCADRKSVV